MSVNPQKKYFKSLSAMCDNKNISTLGLGIAVNIYPQQHHMSLFWVTDHNECDWAETTKEDDFSPHERDHMEQSSKQIIDHTQKIIDNKIPFWKIQILQSPGHAAKKQSYVDLPFPFIYCPFLYGLAAREGICLLCSSRPRNGWQWMNVSVWFNEL